MGTPGVPFNVPKAKILESIKNRRGVVVHVAKDLGYAHETIYKHIKLDPELKAAIDEARDARDEECCDIAEGYLINCMQQFEDRNSGLNAARFYLNNKGRKRGYTPPTVVQPPDSLKPDIDRVLSGFDKLHSAQPQEQPVSHSESQMLTEQPQVNPDISQ